MALTIPARLTSLFSVGIRGAGLAMRFLLSFYIIKFLGYEASGVYGLALGAIGLTPALIGLGLNYFLARDIVGVSRFESGVRVKTRLTVTTIALTTATLLAWLIATAFHYPITQVHLLIAALVWLETYTIDLHVSLIAVELPFLANVLVFVKLALWVPFAIGLGLYAPAYRTIEVIFISWIVSYAFYTALLFWSIRGWPLREVLEARVETEWVTRRLKESWFIYLSDLGMIGSLYIDRYVVSFLLGLRQTGLYTFYWSLTNALQTLVGTAVVQLALPSVYKAYRGGSVSAWSAELRRQIMKVIGFASVLAVLILGASEIIFRVMAMRDLASHRGVFVMLLLATVTRSTSDVFNIGLMSIHKDRQYGYINMAGIVLSALLTFVSIKLFGFSGTALGALLTAVTLTSIRGRILWRFAHTPRPASPAETELTS
ncbi:lipopolysaccharide biosynthesis protein [Sphingomonas sp. DT-51]|uniref:lipopolysaccharide biosynthesis protein n=1 Tax=Sphingomonas sp. DT-51 TaxID=3396165 RepID=UPI003F19EA4F